MKGNAKVAVWIALGVVILCCGGGGFLAYNGIKGAGAKVTEARAWMSAALTDISQDWSATRAEKYFESGALAKFGGEAKLADCKKTFGKFQQLGSTFDMKGANENGRATLGLGVRGLFEKSGAQIKFELVMIGDQFQISRLEMTPETE